MGYLLLGGIFLSSSIATIQQYKTTNEHLSCGTRSRVKAHRYISSEINAYKPRKSINITSNYTSPPSPSPSPSPHLSRPLFSHHHQPSSTHPPYTPTPHSSPSLHPSPSSVPQKNFSSPHPPSPIPVPHHHHSYSFSSSFSLPPSQHHQYHQYQEYHQYHQHPPKRRAISTSSHYDSTATTHSESYPACVP